MKVMSANSKQGMIQALGITFYCAFVGLFFWKGEEIFGNEPTYLVPAAFLLLFSVSALVCVSIVFYKPYTLFFADKKKDAVEIVLYTTFWMFLFFILGLLSVALI